jgi:hypothetical protein
MNGTTLVFRSVGANGTASLPAGGGGGAVGRAFFNTSSGTINPQNGAAVRAAVSTGMIQTRIVP